MIEIQDLVGVILRTTLLHELKNKNIPYHVFQLSLEQVRDSGVRALLIKSRGQLIHKVKSKCAMAVLEI